MSAAAASGEFREIRLEPSTERGSALVLAIFMLVLLSGMGIALLFLTQTELKINQAEIRYRKAFYLAESGIEDARLTLYRAVGNGPLTTAIRDAAGDNNDMDFAYDALEVSYDSAQEVLSVGGFGDDVPLVPLTSFSPAGESGWYMAFLTNDPLEGVNNLTDLNERALITAIGATRDASTEIVQAIVEPDPILLPLPSAAITLLGPAPGFDDGDHILKAYIGDDCEGGGVPGFFVPTVGVIGSTAADQVRLSLGSSLYAAGGLLPAQTIGDLTDPGEPAVSFSIDPDWMDCRAVHDMVEDIRVIADVVCTSQFCTLPPSSPSRVVFADTDFSPGSGAGLLVVTGEMQLHDNPSWDGLLLAIGEGRISRDGSGIGTISGAVIVADIAGPDGIYGNADDCTGGSGGFDKAEFVTGGVGKSTIVYCSTDVDAATPPGPYSIIEFIER